MEESNVSLWLEYTMENLQMKKNPEYLERGVAERDIALARKLHGCKAPAGNQKVWGNTVVFHFFNYF